MPHHNGCAPDFTRELQVGLELRRIAHPMQFVLLAVWGMERGLVVYCTVFVADVYKWEAFKIHVN